MCKQRNPCSECPWTNKTKHNLNMIESIFRWLQNGSRKTIEHRCHMISTDLWNTITPKNVCTGSTNKTLINENITTINNKF